jgi:hypothetical protein
MSASLAHHDAIRPIRSAPAPTPRGAWRGRRRGCKCHRRPWPGRPWPICAAFADSEVPASEPRRHRATVRRCSASTSSHPAMLQARCPPSPCGRLSRPRTTTRAPSRPGATDRRRVPPLAAWLTGESGRSGAVPTFACDQLMEEAPSFAPAALTAGTPQAFPTASGGKPEEESFETPTSPVTAARPTSTEFEPVRSLEGVQMLVQFPCAFPSRRRSLGPFGGSNPMPLLSGLLSTFLLASEVRLSLASPDCCDSPAVRYRTSPGHQAPRGARSRRPAGCGRAACGAEPGGEKTTPAPTS